jgi:hypothetical protein
MKKLIFLTVENENGPMGTLKFFSIKIAQQVLILLPVMQER